MRDRFKARRIVRGFVLLSKSRARALRPALEPQTKPRGRRLSAVAAGLLAVAAAAKALAFPVLMGHPQRGEEGLPLVAIVATNSTATEAGPTNGQFTITRTGITTNPLTVNFTVSGTATPGASNDYASLGTSAVIPANAASATIPVLVQDDAENEGNETVIVTLSSSANYTLGGPSSATVTIVDDDAPVLPSVSIQATANGAEPATHGQFTLIRTGSIASALTVNFTVGGTATPGAGNDYTSLGTSVVITAGSSTAPIPVVVIDDTLFEGSETVIVTLSNSANYTIGSPASATVTITDNEPPPAGPTIVATPATVAPGGTVTGTWSGIVNPAPRDWIGLYAVGAGSGSYRTWVYVICSTAAGSARASGSCGLVVPSNTATGNYELRVLANDGFNVLATSNSFGVATGPVLPSVSIQATANGAEPSTNGQFTVTRTGSTANPLTVNFTVGGTATPGAGNDYASLGTSVVIPANASSVTIPVLAQDDNTQEAAETVIVTLSSNANYAVGAPSSATVTIADDDTPALPSVNIQATANGAEPATNGQFMVTRTGITTNPLNVNFTVGGTATPGTGNDYTSLGTSVVIPAGAAAAPIPVVVLDDNIFEGSETIIVTLSNSANYTIGSPASATVTITDNEPPPAGPSIVAAPASLLPGGTVTGTWSGIVNPTPRDWIALYAVGAGSGSYRTWVYVSCSTAVGAARASGSCGLVVPSNTANGNYELRLLANDGFNVIAASNAFTVGSGPTLPVVSIQATANGAEPSTNGQFTVTRTGDTTNSLTVNFAVGGTATPGAGNDYASLGTSVVVPANASSVTIPVLVQDDNAAEVTETVIVTLSNNASYTIGSPNGATVTLADNEPPPAGPTVTAAPSPVNRGGTLTVNWSGVAPTVRDWIALYPVGGSAGSYRAWVYTSSCSSAPGSTARATGSCGLFVPAGTPIGSYEVRLLANDGFNVIATSAPLTVQ